MKAKYLIESSDFFTKEEAQEVCDTIEVWFGDKVSAQAEQYYEDRWKVHVRNVVSVYELTRLYAVAVGRDSVVSICRDGNGISDKIVYTDFTSTEEMLELVGRLLGI